MDFVKKDYITKSKTLTLDDADIKESKNHLFVDVSKSKTNKCSRASAKSLLTESLKLFNDLHLNHAYMSEMIQDEPFAEVICNHHRINNNITEILNCIDEKMVLNPRSKPIKIKKPRKFKIIYP